MCMSVPATLKPSVFGPREWIVTFEMRKPLTRAVCTLNMMELMIEMFSIVTSVDQRSSTILGLHTVVSACQGRASVQEAAILDQKQAALTVLCGGKSLPPIDQVL